MTPSQCVVNSLVVEGALENVGCDVRDLGWQGRAARRDRQPAEGALVDKAQLRPVGGERERDPQMRAGWLRCVSQQELAAHAQMREHRVT